MKNSAEIKFDSLSVNERFARIAVSAFASALDPTVEELSDIKTAVSEAVTNSIVHGYRNSKGEVEMKMYIDGNVLRIEIVDYGAGIENVKKAMEPFFTTCGDGTRSGMGFTIIKTFMDEVKVISGQNVGTVIDMTKKITSVA